MCGIVGFLNSNNIQDSKSLLKKMTSVIGHRGPDGNGQIVERIGKYEVGLGHSRLSILDISDKGSQPMVYKNWSLIFNGEIYNFREIRNELSSRGHHFETDSDSEVILHSFEEWGESFLSKFIGMFAFALVDNKEKKLILGRDRLGVKPLYRYCKQGTMIFGSELKAFHEHPEFKPEINQNAISAYFRWGYVPESNCIYNHTLKITPGTFEKWNLITGEVKSVKYYDRQKFYLDDKFDISYNEAKKEVKNLLVNAFKYRMVSDVPVGVFLSGGYDSTAVTSILQSDMTEKLKTFTIGFEEGNNEAPFAKKTAEYLGTDHTEIICSEKDAQGIIGSLPFVYDEPFADSSAIPTILVSKIARNSVKVALSADGGDELFAGYNSYRVFDQYYQNIKSIPAIAHKPLSIGLDRIKELLPNELSALKHKFKGLSQALDLCKKSQALGLYESMRSTPDHILSSLFNFEIISTEWRVNTMVSELPYSLLYRDLSHYLPGDILTKVDRATMSVSLEGREPFLDHRILEFAARLPSSYLSKNNYSKRILKDIVHEYLPKETMDRPKTGFSLPIYRWLRGELSYLLDEYLSKDALAESRFFNEEWSLDQVKRFKSGSLHYTPIIWYLLMFQLWYFKWIKKTC